MRKWLVTTAAAVALAAGLISFFARPAWKPVQQTLADGSTLRVEALTFGTNHIFRSHPARETLRRWLPRRLQGFLGHSAFTGQVQTAPNSIVLWTTRFDPKSRMYIYPAYERSRLRDAHGCAFESSSLSASSLGGHALIGIVFEAFPRGDESFIYEITDSSDKIVGGIRIPNIHPAKRKPWIPGTVPITKTNGGLIVQLRRVHFSKATLTPSSFRPEIWFVRPLDSETWERGPAWICDSVGNRSFKTLCTHESAWKIEANFFRNERAEFRPEETWLLKDVAIPRPGETISIQKKNTVQNCVVVVGAFRGVYVDEPRERDVRRQRFPRAMVQPTLQHAPRLHVLANHRFREAKVLIRARDNLARTLVVRRPDEVPAFYSGSSYDRYQQVWQHEFDIYALPDSKSLDIEVLVQKATRFEFFVHPPPATLPYDLE